MPDSHSNGCASVVHIVEDDESIRKALNRLLGAAGFEVATYGSAEEYLAALETIGGGCLILDLDLPGVSGLDLQRALAERGIDIQIIFLTGQGDVSSSVQALKEGAFHFLEKPVDESLLIPAIYGALERDLERCRSRSSLDDLRQRLATLTAREQEVLGEVVSGRLNKQIAGRLGIAERTVKAHRARVMQKMEADSLAELVRIAVHLGLVTPDPV